MRRLPHGDGRQCSRRAPRLRWRASAWRPRTGRRFIGTPRLNRPSRFGTSWKAASVSNGSALCSATSTQKSAGVQVWRDPQSSSSPSSSRTWRGCCSSCSQKDIDWWRPWRQLHWLSVWEAALWSRRLGVDRVAGARRLWAERGAQIASHAQVPTSNAQIVPLVIERQREDGFAYVTRIEGSVNLWGAEEPTMGFAPSSVRSTSLSDSHEEAAGLVLVCHVELGAGRKLLKHLGLGEINVRARLEGNG